jgi:hypothetical protein
MPNTPSEVQIPQVVGPVQALIDNNTVMTSAGSVKRQVITNADPTTPGNYQKTDAAGNSQTREAVSITEIDASATIGTEVVEAIESGAATLWVDMENTSNNGNSVGFTFDGSTPGFTDGQANPGTFLLIPYGTKTYDRRIPSGPLQVVGSAADTTVTIKYA